MTRPSDLDEAPTGLSVEQARAYVEARMQGLCHEGALEVALSPRREPASSDGTDDPHPGPPR